MCLPTEVASLWDWGAFPPPELPLFGPPCPYLSFCLSPSCFLQLLFVSVCFSPFPWVKNDFLFLVSLSDLGQLPSVPRSPKPSLQGRKTGQWDCENWKE